MFVAILFAGGGLGSSEPLATACFRFRDILAAGAVSSTFASYAVNKRLHD